MTEEILRTAISEAVDDFHLDFTRRYREAVEQSGDVRPRRRLLHALADSDRSDFSFDEALAAVRTKFGGDTQYTYFNAAIGTLSSDTHGSLLRKRSIRGRNRYSFRNPLARAYVRLVDTAQAGALNSNSG